MTTRQATRRGQRLAGLVAFLGLAVAALAGCEGEGQGPHIILMPGSAYVPVVCPQPTGKLR